jgi:hypothetical protein
MLVEWIKRILYNLIMRVNPWILNKLKISVFLLIFVHTEGAGAECFLNKESQTRLGHEIESGKHVKIAGTTIQKKLESEYWNETIAQTEKLEAVFDDFPPMPAIEFRSKPMLPALLMERKYWEDLKREIRRFPINAILKMNKGQIHQKEFEERVNASQWSFAGFLKKEDLRRSIRGEFGGTTPSLPQHATLSIPIMGLFTLGKNDRGKIIPWCKDCSDLETFFHTWMEHINPPGSKDIQVSTTRRNQLSPNIKTPIDVLLRFLNPSIPSHKTILLEVQKRFPISISNPNTTLMSDRKVNLPLERLISYHEGLPPQGAPISHLNPFHGKAHVSSEEKPQMPLYDPLLNDLRILVEDRGNALPSAAIRDAYKGKTDKLKELWAITDKLNQPNGQTSAANPLIPVWLKENCATQR